MFSNVSRFHGCKCFQSVKLAPFAEAILPYLVINPAYLKLDLLSFITSCDTTLLLKRLLVCDITGNL